MSGTRKMLYMNSRFLLTTPDMTKNHDKVLQPDRFCALRREFCGNGMARAYSVRAGVRTQCWIFYTSLRIDHFVITSLLIQLLNISKTYLKSHIWSEENLSDFWRSKLKTNNCSWENDFTPLSRPAFTKFGWILLFTFKVLQGAVNCYAQQNAIWFVAPSEVTKLL